MRNYYYIIGFIIFPVLIIADNFEHLYGRDSSSALSIGADSAKTNQELTLRRMKASVEGIGRFANERNLKFGLEEAERSLEYLTANPDTFAKKGKEFSDEQLKEFIQVVFKKSDTTPADFSALREVVDEQRAKYLPKTEGIKNEKDDSNNPKKDSDKNEKDTRDLLESEIDSNRTKSRAYNDPGKTNAAPVSNLGVGSLAIPYPYEIEPNFQNRDADSKKNNSSASTNSATALPINPNAQKSLASVQPVVPVSAADSKSGIQSPEKPSAEKISTKTEKKENEKTISTLGQAETEESKMDSAENDENKKTAKETELPKTSSLQAAGMDKVKDASSNSDEENSQSPIVENSYYNYFSDLAKSAAQIKEGEIPAEPSAKSNLEDNEKIRTPEQTVDYGASGGGFASYRSTGPGAGAKPGDSGVPSGIWLPGKTAPKNLATPLVPSVVRSTAGDLIRRFKARFGDLEKIDTETSRIGIRLPRTLSASLLKVGTGAEAAVRSIDSLLTLQEADAENLESNERYKRVFLAGTLLSVLLGGIWYRKTRRRAK